MCPGMLDQTWITDATICRLIGSQLVFHTTHGIGFVESVDPKRGHQPIRIRFQKCCEFFDSSADGCEAIVDECGAIRVSNTPVAYEPGDRVFHRLNGLGVVVAVDALRDRLFIELCTPPGKIIGPLKMSLSNSHKIVSKVRTSG